MKPRFVVVLLCTAVAAAAGCQAPATSGENPSAIRPSGDSPSAPPPAPQTFAPRAVAQVDDAIVTQTELDAALRESYGVDMMLKLIQLRMAEQEAKSLGVQVTDADIDAETMLTMRQAFPSEDPESYPKLADQLVKQLRVTPQEFRIVMRTNATLRKSVTQQLAPRITDEMLRQHFNAMYGEKVVVRHIALTNLQEVAEAKRRLAAGQSFEQVAREMSKSPRTAAVGGLLPPFSRNANVGRAFAEASFAMQVGQVSDAVEQDNLYHLIRLEQRIEPTVVKFEDHRDAVRADLEVAMSQEPFLQARQRMGRRALEAMAIHDVPLRAEFDRRKAAAQQRTVGRDQVLRDPSMQFPTTSTTTTAPAPATAPATTQSR